MLWSWCYWLIVTRLIDCYMTRISHAVGSIPNKGHCTVFGVQPLLWSVNIRVVYLSLSFLLIAYLFTYASLTDCLLICLWIPYQLLIGYQVDDWSPWLYMYIRSHKMEPMSLKLNLISTTLTCTFTLPTAKNEQSYFFSTQTLVPVWYLGQLWWLLIVL